MTRFPAEEKIDQLLGAYHDQDFVAAERLARAVTRKWPGFDLGWNILSAALHAQGKLDKAAEAYRRALSVASGSAELHDNYGALLLQQGRATEAVTQFRESLALNDGSAGTHANLATALLMTGQPEAAVEHCRRAVELEPGNAALHNTLGNALKAAGEPEQARAAYERAVELNPYHSKAHFNLAVVLQEAGDVDAAERHYKLAIQSNPDYARARCSLGNLLAMSGRLDEAMEAYRQALARQPDLAEAHRYLAWLKTFTEHDADLNAIEELLAGRELSDGDRAQLHYAAGKARQDIGDDPARAFRHFREGAALRRREFHYEVTADEDLFRRIAEAFPDKLEAGGLRQDDPPLMVFIVGMPRSGTTLVEQILGAHPDVHPLGEVPFMPNEVASLDAALGTVYPQWISRVSPGTLGVLAEGYVEAAQARCPDALAFTDKLTDNFKYLGLIARVLPGARIVHVGRSPLDTCLSCFTQYFSPPIPYACDLEELGRYYRAYHGLMEHWRAVMPDGMMMDLAYESLVREPEEHIRRLLGHCGLAWDERCLAFQGADRLIATASVAQARRPVHQGSVGRWKIYEDELTPLRRALGDLAC